MRPHGSLGEIRRAAAALLALCILSCSGPPNSNTLGARIAAIDGDVKSFDTASGEWTAARAGQRIEYGDSISSGAGARAVVKVAGNTVTIGEQSKLSFDQTLDSVGLGLQVFVSSGTALCDIDNPHGSCRHFAVRTPVSLVSARGTYFSVSFDVPSYEADVQVIEGEVAVVNPRIPMPPVAVAPGYYTVVRPMFVPLAPVRIDYVRWQAVAPLAPHVFIGYGKRLGVVGFRARDARAHVKNVRLARTERRAPLVRRAAAPEAAPMVRPPLPPAVKPGIVDRSPQRLHPGARPGPRGPEVVPRKAAGPIRPAVKAVKRKATPARPVERKVRK